MAWREPSRKEGAEQLGGPQQVARGRRVFRRARGAKRIPDEPAGRQAARRAQSDHKGAALRVARKAPSILDTPVSQEGASPRWKASLQRV